MKKANVFPQFSELPYLMVLNLKLKKKLNNYMPYIQLKMEIIKAVHNLVNPNYWMARIDIKDAYYPIPI